MSDKQEYDYTRIHVDLISSFSTIQGLHLRATSSDQIFLVPLVRLVVKVFDLDLVVLPLALLGGQWFGSDS